MSEDKKTGRGKAVLVTRILLGLMFVVFGLNGFFLFIKVPKPPTPQAATFMKVLITSKMMLLVKTLEIIGGLLIISGYFVPLGLAILAPIVVNIFAYHAFMAVQGLPVAAVLMALQLFLLWSYRDTVPGLFQAQHG